MGVCQRLLYVPGVPQQHMLVIAGDILQINMQTSSKADSVQQVQKKIWKDHMLFTTLNVWRDCTLSSSSSTLKITEEDGHTSEEQLEGIYLPVARRFSRWGLHWMLHTPIECLQKRNIQQREETAMYDLRRDSSLNFKDLESTLLHQGLSGKESMVNSNFSPVKHTSRVPSTQSNRAKLFSSSLSRAKLLLTQSLSTNTF